MRGDVMKSNALRLKDVNPAHPPAPHLAASHHWSAGDYIVLSLNPEPFEQIISGRKHFEYRTRFRRSRFVAFIYVTRPVQQIRAVMECGDPIFGSARKIADFAEHDQPGNGRAIYDYLASSGKGCAIPIVRTREFEPLTLARMRKDFGFSPPQFYSALEKTPDFLEFLLSYAAQSRMK